MAEEQTILATFSHIVRARARWFHYGIGEGGAEAAALLQNGASEAPLSADKLVAGLETTWRLIRSSLVGWTPEDQARPFQRQRGGQEALDI